MQHVHRREESISIFMSHFISPFINTVTTTRHSRGLWQGRPSFKSNHFEVRFTWLWKLTTVFSKVYKIANVYLATLFIQSSKSDNLCFDYHSPAILFPSDFLVFAPPDGSVRQRSKASARPSRATPSADLRSFNNLSRVMTICTWSRNGSPHPNPPSLA